MTTAEELLTDDEETGRKSFLPAWAKFPKWTPKALMGTALVVLAFALYNVVNIVVRLMIALHAAPVPWWVVFFVYTFLGGAAFRASKEVVAWVAAAKNRWGVFTRWSKSLV